MTLRDPSSTLMAQVRATHVPRRSFALWFLGQNGWIIKAPSGFTLAIDPYLSDSCNGKRSGIDFSRNVPIAIPPELLCVDLIVCTHSHQDHCDPWTLVPCRECGSSRFVGPAETQAVFAECGIPESDRRLTWPNDVVEYRDIRLTGVFALPTDATDLTHMGFVVQVDDGPKVYITGDTGWTDLLETAARHQPDVMLTCINAGLGNLSHWQAAELVKRVNPTLAVPCHYDMFPGNSCPPDMFRASLVAHGIGDKYHHLAHATRFMFTRD
ncbi:MAG: MBL fold metallo-hydrolase [bacterium]